MEEKKMEGMLSQLIGMVGNMREDLLGVKEEICLIKEDLKGVKEEICLIKEDLKGVKEDLQGVKEELQGVKEDLQGVKDEQKGMRAEINSIKEEQRVMKEQNELRHKEIMEKFNSLVIDQEYTWLKAARNEREIAKLKKLLEV